MVIELIAIKIYEVAEPGNTACVRNMETQTHDNVGAPF